MINLWQVYCLCQNRYTSHWLTVYRRVLLHLVTEPSSRVHVNCEFLSALLKASTKCPDLWREDCRLSIIMSLTLNKICSPVATGSLRNNRTDFTDFGHCTNRLSCLSYSFAIFTVRRSALHGLCDRNSVSLSVRPPSHSWTVSTWFDLRSWFLHHMVAPSF